MPIRPRSAQPLSTWAGISSSWSICSPSIASAAQASTLAQMASPIALSSSACLGKGKHIEASKSPMNMDAMKLFDFQSSSRLSSATAIDAASSLFRFLFSIIARSTPALGSEFAGCRSRGVTRVNECSLSSV